MLLLRMAGVKQGRGGQTLSRRPLRLRAQNSIWNKRLLLGDGGLGEGQTQYRAWAHSRGQRADVLVAAERQADGGEGAALGEHLGDLGGQVAGGGHEHLPKVASPGSGLLLGPGGTDGIRCGAQRPALTLSDTPCLQERKYRKK